LFILHTLIASESNRREGGNGTTARSYTDMVQAGEGREVLRSLETESRG